MLTNIKENQHQVILEVEIDSIDLLIPAIKGGVDAVLLDNFSPERVREAVNINQERVVLEASGGIKKDSLEKYAQTRPHFISTGSPIHASRWVDIGLDWL
jgi:nicotinate-nucleotide pyrophosphorylase (carboxylating)